MLKKIVGLVLSMVLFSTAAFAADEVWLPDPGLSLFTAGKLLAESESIDGVTYSVYGYTAEKKPSKSISWSLWVYELKTEQAGFTWSAMDEKTNYDGMQGDEWYSIECNGLTAQICASGSYFASSLVVTLYVPEGMPFHLEEEVGSRSSFQNDIYVDSFSLETTSGATRVTCMSCHGSGRCGICNGTGSWNNPYNGHKMECTSCEDGVCSVCDGTGYWGD